MINKNKTLLSLLISTSWFNLHSAMIEVFEPKLHMASASTLGFFMQQDEAALLWFHPQLPKDTECDLQQFSYVYDAVTNRNIAQFTKSGVTTNTINQEIFSYNEKAKALHLKNIKKITLCAMFNKPLSSQKFSHNEQLATMSSRNNILFFNYPFPSKLHVFNPENNSSEHTHNDNFNLELYQKVHNCALKLNLDIAKERGISQKHRDRYKLLTEKAFNNVYNFCTDDRSIASLSNNPMMQLIMITIHNDAQLNAFHTQQPFCFPIPHEQSTLNKSTYSTAYNFALEKSINHATTVKQIMDQYGQDSNLSEMGIHQLKTNRNNDLKKLLTAHGHQLL
jgi:hypothetical protein